MGCVRENRRCLELASLSLGLIGVEDDWVDKGSSPWLQCGAVGLCPVELQI